MGWRLPESPSMRSGLFSTGVRPAMGGGRTNYVRPTEMGAGIAASPHLHRDMDLPVFASLETRGPPTFRSWLTSSGVASNRGPARRQVLDFPRPFLGRVLPRRLFPREPRTA